MEIAGVVYFHDHDFSMVKSIKLKDLNSGHLFLSLRPLLEKADLAIYRGHLGCKIIKSRFCSTKIIEDLSKRKATK